MCRRAAGSEATTHRIGRNSACRAATCVPNNSPDTTPLEGSSPVPTWPWDFRAGPSLYSGKPERRVGQARTYPSGKPERRVGQAREACRASPSDASGLPKSAVGLVDGWEGLWRARGCEGPPRRRRDGPSRQEALCVSGRQGVTRRAVASTCAGQQWQEALCVSGRQGVT